MCGQFESEPALGSGRFEAFCRGGTETLGAACGGVCS
jgi:hypothetical protein